TRINEPLFHQTGVLWLAYADDPYLGKCAETLRKVGIPFERLTTAEVGERYPQIGLQRISWALLELDGGALIARRAVQAVAHEATKSGAEYLQDAVKTPRGKRELQCITNAGGRRISAGHYVFACGPWLPGIFPDLFADRIHSTRHAVVFVCPPSR